MAGQPGAGGLLSSSLEPQVSSLLGVLVTAYQKTFERLKKHAHQTALWVTTESVLGWDERTMMPTAAADYRTEQITLLAGTIHAHRTEPKLGHWLAELAESPLAADPASDTGATIRHLKRDYDKR